MYLYFTPVGYTFHPINTGEIRTADWENCSYRTCVMYYLNHQETFNRKYIHNIYNLYVKSVEKGTVSS